MTHARVVILKLGVKLVRTNLCPNLYQIYVPIVTGVNFILMVRVKVRTQ